MHLLSKVLVPCHKYWLGWRSFVFFSNCIDLIYLIRWRIFHFCLQDTYYTLYLMNFHILQFWVHWCICLWPFLGSIKKFYGYDYWQSNIKNYVVPNFQNKKIGKFYLLCTIYKVLVLWDHTYADLEVAFTPWYRNNFLGCSKLKLKLKLKYFRKQ